MKKLFFFLAILSFSIACKETPGNENDATKDGVDSTTVVAPANSDTTATKTGVNLETFTNLPFNPQNGCACVFSLSEADFKGVKLVYADDNKDAAYINLNGTITKLNKKSDSANGDRLIKVYANDQFEVNINVLKVDQLDKTVQYKGSMVFKPKKGETVNHYIYGECRC